MWKRVDPPKSNKRPGQIGAKPINYHKSLPNKELNDSDYEPLAK